MKKLIASIFVVILAAPLIAYAGSSLQAQTELDNLTKMMNERNYSHEERISNYKAFIRDYPGTLAAKEADELISQEKKFVEKEQEKEQAVKKKGYIDDPEAGLQWVPAPGYLMNWNQASEYVQRLIVAGGGWRLPTRAELRSLYGRLSSLGGRELFINSGLWVWSGEIHEGDPSFAWAYVFGNAQTGPSPRSVSIGTARVLAVRSRR